MARKRITKIRAGDTEPIEIDLDPDDDASFANLDDLSTAVLYARKSGASTNHVDGASCTISDSANNLLSFDPVGAKSGGGNAFDAAGTYNCYVKLTWDDGDITRHPDSNDNNSLVMVVEANFE